MYTNKINFFLSYCLLTLSMGQVDYNSEIQPIFNSSCTGCYQDGGANQEGLDFNSYDNLMAGDSDNGPVIIPGDHIRSPLWQKVISGAMPPVNNPDLNSDEIDLIAAWIDEGAFEEPTGCTDPEAYNCADDVFTDENPNYIFDVGGVMYDNSCNWDWNTSTWEAEYVGGCELDPCEGYYNPAAITDDGLCRYYQAPHEEEVYFEVVDDSTIYIDWTAFNPPVNGVIESYHVLRCTEVCSWIPSFTPGDQNIMMNVFDTFKAENGFPDGWEAGVKIKYAIAVKYVANPYWGWAIGASYITPCNLGDLNGDGEMNILDIVTLANCVLAESCSSLEYGCAGDLNGDGGYNVLDIVTLYCVLAENCGGRVDDASDASLIKKDNKLSFKADGFIGGIQLRITHSSDFTIEMTGRALLADYLTTGNETHLLVIKPETDELFSFTGEFEITEVIVANSQYEVSVDMPIAASFNLSDAYPNPFNPVTTMTLTMPMAGDITVEVYNLLGQVVATLASGYMEASTYTLTWDASNASSGVYFVQADAAGFTKTQKLMLVK